LNDETVINSLSAVEAGKVDEVLARVNTAREGGVGGGIGIQGAKVEGSKKSTSEFEEEMSGLVLAFLSLKYGARI
jgi:hypothetical protein